MAKCPFMIAIVVMSVGILAVIASFATAVAATQSAQEDLIARQKALEAMESIYTARNSQQIPFASVANVANGGIFLSGAQTMKCAGPDGLVNTQDDVNCTTQTGVVCPDNGAECMYYSQYNTGIFKCCNAVYGAPTRNYFFDTLFQDPSNLPPGTPSFQDVVSLSYHQAFTPQ